MMNGGSRLLVLVVALLPMSAIAGEHEHPGNEIAAFAGLADEGGENALALFAPQAAVEQLGRAIESAQHLDDPSLHRLHYLRGRAFALLGEFARVVGGIDQPDGEQQHERRKQRDEWF